MIPEITVRKTDKTAKLNTAIKDGEWITLYPLKQIVAKEGECLTIPTGIILDIPKTHEMVGFLAPEAFSKHSLMAPYGGYIVTPGQEIKVLTLALADALILPETPLIRLRAVPKQERIDLVEERA